MLLPLSTTIEERAEQPSKAQYPMLVTLLGMVTEVREEQPPKAIIPILVTLLGMVTEVREEQPLKAPYPILVTLLGMVVFLQPTTRVFVAVSIIALQFSRLSYVLLPLSTTIAERAEQPSKALFPILVTLLGIVTEVREEQL